MKSLLSVALAELIAAGRSGHPAQEETETVSFTKRALEKAWYAPWELTPAEQAFTRTFPSGQPWPDDDEWDETMVSRRSGGYIPATDEEYREHVERTTIPAAEFEGGTDVRVVR